MKWFLPVGDEPFDPIGRGPASPDNSGGFLAGPAGDAGAPADQAAAGNPVVWATLLAVENQSSTEGGLR
ncbi:hypothetical protein AMK25_05040 [Micromonospora sp. TSRI0369]|nr:hypothetical protein AMK25_05040 [Micromonospora sp. TSRI0369]